MGTHAGALGIALFAYAYSRRHARDERYSFGTGKVGALAGFASAVGLALIAAWVCVDSVTRLASPAVIRFDEAILVAVIGLAVNLSLRPAAPRPQRPRPFGTRRNSSPPRPQSAGRLRARPRRLPHLRDRHHRAAGRQAGRSLVDGSHDGNRRVSGDRLLGGRPAEGNGTRSPGRAGDREGSRREFGRPSREKPGTRVTDLHLWWIGPGPSCVHRFPHRAHAAGARPLSRAPFRNQGAGARHGGSQPRRGRPESSASVILDGWIVLVPVSISWTMLVNRSFSGAVVPWARAVRAM